MHRVLRMPRDPGVSKEQGFDSTSLATSKQPVRICVFCSTSLGQGEAPLVAARSLAQSISTNGAQLVYGGGTTGLMGEVAKTFVDLNGPQNVYGIIPRDVLELERPEGVVGETQSKSKDTGPRGRTLKEKLGLAPGISEKRLAKSPTTESALLSESVYGHTTIVTDLQARKKLMCQLVNEGGPGSGFIALSGGFGTMDELMEMITVRQYGIHHTRICLLNIEGFWDPLLAWIEAAVEKGFIRREVKNTLAAKTTPEECISWLRNG